MIEIKQENAKELKYELYNTIKNAPNVTEVEWINLDKHGFSRTLSFTIRDRKYKIVWMWNYSELFFEDNSMVLFDKCFVSGTWPNQYKTNLQFYLDKRPIAIIPIEEY